MLVYKSDHTLMCVGEVSEDSQIIPVTQIQHIHKTAYFKNIYTLPVSHLAMTL
jgi:hypothetical protein